jgi:two-component system chemotaxis response regulator CheY
MNLTEQLVERLTDLTLTVNKRAQMRCQLAKELEESGDHEGACQAMGEMWRGVGERPPLQGLNEATKAEVLLRAGVLTGWLGSIQQLPDAQEQAKNLISESSRMFEELHAAEKVDEAQTELARCYWRQGAFNEARSFLQAVLERLADSNCETKLVAAIRRAIVERSAKSYHDALRILTEYASLCDQSINDALKGKFHNEFAIVLGILGTAENREDYIDRALIEYAAASYHFEQAGHIVYCACAENNLAMLYLSLNRYAEAHEHLDRARQVIADLKDSTHFAQVMETRARVFLAEGRNEEAEKAAGTAVQTLEQGDALALLAEALTTQGVALARIKHNVRARHTLERAITTAEQAGDFETAGRASLVVIEELSAHVPSGELCVLYTHADDLLTHSQQSGITARLRAAARLVIRRLMPQATTPEAASADWRGFSLRKAIHRYERSVIERALKDAGGMVSRAARLLGFKYHQSLISLLNHRHKDLLPARTPVVRRRRSAVGQERSNTGRQAHLVTVLHAEDNQIVADGVRETLELEGWSVVTCSEGATALKRIESDANYDVLLLDYDLPRINGLELVRRARQLAHRKRTPIIMFSATDCEREAWRAGVTAFLRKPDDVSKLVETIARVLVIGSKR